jgi:class 3 adenylate cyclase
MSAALRLRAPATGVDAATARTGHTHLSSVLAANIVDFSRKPVTEQLLLKERFNALVATALAAVAADDRIVLDTGAGVAISFLGDPGDALRVAGKLRAAFRAALAAGAGPEVRIGIDLGPVRLVRGPGGTPSVVGDGINVAQRVSGFAAPGEILVSRAYHEALPDVVGDATQLFVHRGSHTDGQLRSHELYAVAESLPAALTDPPGPGGVPAAAPSGARPVGPDVPGPRWWQRVGVARAAALASVAGLAAVLVHAAVHRMADHRADVAPTAGVRHAAALPKASKDAATSADRAGVQGVPGEAEPAPHRDTAHAGAPSAPTPRPTRSAPGRQAVAAGPGPVGDPGLAMTGALGPAPVQALPAPAEKAVIAFAVSPWGEVYVNGAKVGVSPPLNVVEVAPGRVEVEIRNGAAEPYAASMEVSPGERVRLKHRF